MVDEVDGNESEGDLEKMTWSSGRRHRSTSYKEEGMINQAYTEILADQLCRNKLLSSSYSLHLDL